MKKEQGKENEMYRNILMKDLKRKKTMNFILLIFIILATMFISSSADNMYTIATAIDRYFEKAGVPDYWFALIEKQEAERFFAFARENDYEYRKISLMQLDTGDILIDGEAFDYANTACLSTLEGSRVFDSESNPLERIADGEIYVTSNIFHSDKNHFYEGGKVVIKFGETEREFTIKGYVKDALFGSDMISMTRFLVSENDYKLFSEASLNDIDSVAVYTKDSDYLRRFQALELSMIFHVDYNTIKLMYVMDMIIAAILLVVSICLILISMVILHFTIGFTISGEFREIGVMKAVGIPNGKIRGLYLVKYLAISIVGAVIGLSAGFPFGRFLLESVSDNILLTGGGHVLLNAGCAAATVAVILGFCYFCTGKVKKISPVAAIKNGESGERFHGKGVIHLNRAGLAPVWFLAVNDILSSIRRFLSMIVIFTLGILLIIIPVNTINTLQSDHLINWFSMAESDLVISQEVLFSPEFDNKKMIEDKLEEVREILHENHIEAKVFQEILFRVNISHGDLKMSSFAFSGVGDVTTESYPYIRGTAPQSENEIAISYLIAERIGADIGDDVEINLGGETKKYTVTAINQSMNNLGECIRFYQNADPNYQYAAGSFGIQIQYTDHPKKSELEERKELLMSYYSDADFYTAGEYISYMTGDVAKQLESVKSLILGIVLCINILVAVLMEKSFLAKEKSEIAILKAVGFANASLILWQTIRIGLVLCISILLGTLLSAPLSEISVVPVFQMMGAYSIEFEVIPFEVYVVYPLIILAGTAAGAYLSALGIGSIRASETSNIE